MENLLDTINGEALNKAINTNVKTMGLGGLAYCNKARVVSKGQELQEGYSLIQEVPWDGLIGLASIPRLEAEGGLLVAMASGAGRRRRDHQLGEGF